MSQQGDRLTRYYPNGDRVVYYSGWDSFPKDYGTVKEWKDYNQTFRFGNALFVNGECVYDGAGYHTPEKLAEYAARERQDMAAEQTAAAPYREKSELRQWLQSILTTS